MKTPKEKAEELVSKFKEHSQSSIDSEIAKEFNLRNIEYTKSKFVAMMRWSKEYHAKKNALIAIDEILEFGNQLGIREPMMYWNKVKQEINKL